MTRHRGTASVLALSTVLTGIAATRWAGEPVPVADASLFNAVQLDQHITWAYGVRVPDLGLEPLLLAKDDRDGRGWTVVPTAPVSGGGRINAIAAVSARDAWLVGDFDATAGGIVAGHWNGRAWQRAPVPDPAVALSAVAGGWAAGNTSGDQPALLHFDGHTWSTVPTLQYTGLYGELTALAANGPDEVWAVGRVLLDDNDAGHALVAHWDGHRWRQVTTPPGAGPLSAVTAVPGGIAVVGSSASSSVDGYGMRLTGNRWTSLDIPADDTVHALPAGILYSAGRLTVVGMTSSARPPEPQPLILTGRS